MESPNFPCRVCSRDPRAGIRLFSTGGDLSVASSTLAQELFTQRDARFVDDPRGIQEAVGRRLFCVEEIHFVAAMAAGRDLRVIVSDSLLNDRGHVGASMSRAVPPPIAARPINSDDKRTARISLLTPVADDPGTPGRAFKRTARHPFRKTIARSPP
jgi:hypothetical protein